MFSDQRSRTLLTGFVAIAFFLVIASLWTFRSEGTTAVDVLFSPVAQVKQRDFAVYVTETANLDARQSVLLSSELPSNRAKSVFLVAEGELVSSGDVVARFDPTSFEEDSQEIRNDIEEQGIKLAQAQIDLALQHTESEDRAAELNYQIQLAVLKLQSLEQGNIPIRIAQAKKEALYHKAEFGNASATRHTEEELFDKGLTNKKSLKDAQNKEAESRAAYNIADQNLTVLQKITLPAELRQARLQLENNEREVEVYKLSRGQQEQKHAATIAQIEHRIAALKQDLERTRGYLEKTVLKAPVSGIVLYKTLSMQGEKRKVQVGDSLWNRQGFAVIPDLSGMVAFVDVRENEVGKLAVGQTATIAPEAYPQLRLQGEVQTIGTLASNNIQQQSKYFRVRIALNESDERLRPGMSARVSILVREYAQATVIPIEAVFYQQQEAVGFLWRDGKPLKVQLDLGDSDDKYVAVLNGVEPGQQVMLVYPDSFESAADVTH